MSKTNVVLDIEGLIDLSDKKRIAVAGRARPTQRYRVLYGDLLEAEGLYVLVGGNFVARWFADLAAVLARMVRVLRPGGLLLSAYPGVDSCRKWREHCLRQGAPFSGNCLPDRAAVAAVQEGTAIGRGQREVRLLVVCACECFDYLQGTGSGISTRGIAP